MISCSADVNDPFQCPDKWSLWRMLMALLPSGRAFQTHIDLTQTDTIGSVAQYGTYELGGPVGLGAEQAILPRTGLQRYWLAFAEVLEALHARACALLLEWVCHTADETLPEWGVDYAFPGDCPAWATLCDKVAAQGGARCDYWQGLALKRGWSISCLDCNSSQANCFEAGCGQACDCPPNTVYIAVDTAESPAYAAEDESLSSLQCLIEQVRHAHLRIIYVLT